MTGPDSSDFLVMTMENVQENIIALSKSKAKKPRPRKTWITFSGEQGPGCIAITVARVPSGQEPW